MFYFEKIKNFFFKYKAQSFASSLILAVAVFMGISNQVSEDLYDNNTIIKTAHADTPHGGGGGGGCGSSGCSSGGCASGNSGTGCQG